VFDVEFESDTAQRVVGVDEFDGRAVSGVRETVPPVGDDRGAGLGQFGGQALDLGVRGLELRADVRTDLVVRVPGLCRSRRPRSRRRCRRYRVG
jgi:hypothetical protein